MAYQLLGGAFQPFALVVLLAYRGRQLRVVVQLTNLQCCVHGRLQIGGMLIQQNSAALIRSAGCRLARRGVHAGGVGRLGDLPCFLL
jgi:hypothetical protein